MTTLDIASIAKLVASASGSGGSFDSELLMDNSEPFKRTIVLRPLTDSQLAALGYRIGGVDVRSGAFHNGRIVEQRLTVEQWHARQITATAVLFAESGGVTNARCYNVDGADGKPTCSPRPPAGPRGTDRGIAQFNDKAWPMIPDTAADNPGTAVKLVALITNGYRDWGPWEGSAGLDPNSAPFKAARAQYEDTLGIVIDKGLFGLPGETAVYGAVEGVFGTILGWAEALGKLLSVLLSVAFWRRVGMGALGLVLVALALSTFLR